MARLIDTLAGRFGIIVLMIHVLLLPALYLGVDRIVTRSHEEMFVTEIRTYARVLADEFELGTAMESEARVRALLENVLLSGEGEFAELVAGDQVMRSELDAQSRARSFPGEDFAFGAGGDDIYFLSVPIMRDQQEAVLRIGFDERPVIAQIQRARTRILTSLGAYLVVSLWLAIYLGLRLSRPLVELKQASRRVASGDMATSLSTDSSISELRELASDLETMRVELIEVGRRLRQEMRERETAEMERARLEDKLRQRQRLETVGTLAGGIAHEFNNILLPIQLYTELAIEELDETNATRADLTRVLEGARRAKRIISDILAFSRHPEGDMFAPMDVVAIAAEVLHLYERLAAAGIAVHGDFDPGRPRAIGDPTMLHQVIANLCSNACQAMAGRVGQIRIGVQPASDAAIREAGLPPAGYVEVFVSDQGHGMNESTRARIFEPFFTTRPVGEGTGLGLSVVHGMVESMGGAVLADSIPGTGTTFRVFLRQVPELQAQTTT